MREISSGDIHLPYCDISLNQTWMVGGGDVYMSIYQKRTGKIQHLSVWYFCLLLNAHDRVQLIMTYDIWVTEILKDTSKYNK